MEAQIGRYDPDIYPDSTSNDPIADELEMERMIMDEESYYCSDEAAGKEKSSFTEKCSLKETEDEEISDGEGQGCPICFEPWSNSGPHRLSSLSCGHLFGRSCIERWLKGKETNKCPQCNCPVKKKDIRNIYCRTLKVIDTTERDRALKELEEEKAKRTRAEEENMRTKIQYEIARGELERLKEQLQQQTRLHQQQRLLAESNASSQSCSAESSQLATIKHFIHQKTIQIAQSKARVMTFDQTHGMMVVSKPSPNQLFPGCGVVKVSSLEVRSSEYISIHQNTIRDVSFNKRGGRLLLSASMDKTLKITSMLSNSIVQSYKCSAPVWSCRWNETDTNYIYSGLQNGHCLVFDVRRTDEPVRDFQAISGSSCPVVSISYVPQCIGAELSAEGLLVCTLTEGCFWENCKDTQFVAHPLSLSPGSFSGIAFDENSRQCMASYRPSKYFSKSRHLIYKLSGSGIDSSQANGSLCKCRQVQQLVGGNISKLLSRAALFSFENLYAAAGDEASNSVLLWNCETGAQIQKIPSSAPVLDIVAFQSNGANFLSTLNEQRLSIYRWE